MAGIKRLVSRPVQKRDPISSEDDVIRARKFAEPSGDHRGVFLADCGCIMYEAQLRLDDLRSILLGDIVWQPSHVTLFLGDLKTDAFSQGQMGILQASEYQSLAYTPAIAHLQRAGKFGDRSASPPDSSLIWGSGHSGWI